jgi:hypothetical protein
MKQNLRTRSRQYQLILELIDANEQMLMSCFVRIEELRLELSAGSTHNRFIEIDTFETLRIITLLDIRIEVLNQRKNTLRGIIDGILNSDS